MSHNSWKHLLFAMALLISANFWSLKRNTGLVKFHKNVNPMESFNSSFHKETMSIWKAGADPGFPVGGVACTSNAGAFRENVYKNERIGSCWGGHAPEKFVCSCEVRRPGMPTYYLLSQTYSGFGSTSHFYIYKVCVDRSGSLSGGAFNQLRLATLNIVLTILY